MIPIWHITIASPSDRDYLVAEIFFGDTEWAEINQEHGALEVEFYPRPDGQPWCLPLDVVIVALEKARQKLIE